MQTLTNSPTKVTMHGEMLTYGLKRGTKSELLHIDSVPNGLGCNCVCPHCKHELLAKNGGSKNTHHFAHASGAEECGKGRMTALHMLAQNILKREKKVMLPDYKGDYYSKSTKRVDFNEVVLEETLEVNGKQIRPDCIGKIFKSLWQQPHVLLIEICVTHKVDEQKQQLLRDTGKACVEIDISDMLNTDYTEESVMQRLLEEKEDRVWICCPKYDAINERYRLKAKQEEENYRKKEEENRKNRIEEERKREEYRLRHQEEVQMRSKSIASSLRYYEEQEFKTPNMSLDRRDRIIQAVHRKSIIPTNENYSEEFVEEFNKLCQEAQKP